MGNRMALTMKYGNAMPVGFRAAAKARNEAEAKVQQRRQAKKRKQKFRPPPAYQANMGADFYDTREWLEVRYATLERGKGRCQCCGSGRKEGAVLQVDHIKPRSLYPALELDPSNLQVLCQSCNCGKSNLSTTDWR